MAIKKTMKQAKRQLDLFGKIDCPRKPKRKRLYRVWHPKHSMGDVEASSAPEAKRIVAQHYCSIHWDTVAEGMSLLWVERLGLAER